MDIPNLRWWGWGTLDQDFSLEGRPAFWPMLQEWLELPDEAIHHETPPVSLEEISLRPPRLDDPMLSSLRKLLGEEAVRTDKQTRVEHAYGKSYTDLVLIRAGHIPHPPDVVVYPADQGQVASLLAWAADRDVAVVPFGGGSSVLGGVEPALAETLTAGGFDGTATLTDTTSTITPASIVFVNGVAMADVMISTPVSSGTITAAIPSGPGGTIIFPGDPAVTSNPFDVIGCNLYLPLVVRGK